MPRRRISTTPTGSQGKLLLIVGEMDTNVPPESTMRLVDALIKAGKDFELVVVPGANHGMGGAYGQRRLRDFFVRHLLDDGAERLRRHRRPSRRPRSALPRAPDDCTPRIAASRVIELGARPGRDEQRPQRASGRDRALRDRPGQPAAVASAVGLARARRADARVHRSSGSTSSESSTSTGLSQDGKVDYLLLKNQLAHELRQLDIRGKETAESASLVPFARPILELDEAPPRAQADGLVEGRRRSDQADQADRRRSAAPSSAIRAARTRPKRIVVNRALATTEGLRATLRGWFGFYDGYDPLFTWWVQEPYKAADQAIDAYAGLLRQQFGAVAQAAGEGFGPGGGRRRGRRRRTEADRGAKTRRQPARAAPTRPPRARARSSATRSAARRCSPSSSTR